MLPNTIGIMRCRKGLVRLEGTLWEGVEGSSRVRILWILNTSSLVSFQSYLYSNLALCALIGIFLGGFVALGIGVVLRALWYRWVSIRTLALKIEPLALHARLNKLCHTKLMVLAKLVGCAHPV
jgi:hypothetical protein